MNEEIGTLQAMDTTEILTLAVAIGALLEVM